MSSGRINLDGFSSEPFQMFENLNIDNKNKYKNTGNIHASKISNLFFSQENIDYIQDKIVKEVYKKTNNKHLITKQNEDELIIVMKSIFLQNSRNYDSELQYQLNTLNKLVLDYCVPNVYTNLLQYLKYLEDITKEQYVMDRPQSVDIKGNKTLMRNHFI